MERGCKYMGVENGSRHHSGMPDAAYFRLVDRDQYAWQHRMEGNPLEGFRRGKSSVAPETNAQVDTEKTMPSTGVINNFRGQSMAEAIQQERDWYNSRS